MTERNGNGICELCNHTGPTQAHHRQTRRFGADCPCNIIHLCRDCHHERVHAHPAAARANGWIVSRHILRAHHPSVPVLLYDGWMYLTCEGDAIDARQWPR